MSSHEDNDNPQFSELFLKFLAYVDSRTPEQSREFLIRIGQIDDEGNLTTIYGGDAEPSDKYEPLIVKA